MTEEELKVIQALRNRGFSIIVWTPEEIGEADVDTLEDVVIERGNNYLESVR